MASLARTAGLYLTSELMGIKSYTNEEVGKEKRIKLNV